MLKKVTVFLMISFLALPICGVDFTFRRREPEDLREYIVEIETTRLVKHGPLQLIASGKRVCNLRPTETNLMVRLNPGDIVQLFTYVPGRAGTGVKVKQSLGKEFAVTVDMEGVEILVGLDDETA